MGADTFVHLHIHSEYSLLDGSIRVKKLVKELVARQCTAAALTDHDGMHGGLEFYLECMKEKINGIIGFEANVQGFTSRLSKKTFHLVLLAENDVGYKNLIKLSSIANTTGKSAHGENSTSIDWSELEKYGSGLICLTSCMHGEMAHLIKDEHTADAVLFLEKLRLVFGNTGVYIELIDNNLPDQKVLIPKLARFAAENNAPIVATADVHYLKPKDKDTHLQLLAIKHKLQQADLREVDRSYEFHLATAEEMLEKFKDYPEAIANTKLIADRCNIKIDTKSIFMPDFRINPDESADDCMARLARKGLEDRRPAIELAQKSAFTEELWEQYKQRLEYEINVINKMKFAGYFLIVQDFINWAKDQKIPVGPGRGSAAGSLVTYALKITNIDPLRFNLLFERFLNPERVSMPDIDTDFCQDRRGEVIDYVYARYGHQNVCQIVTFGRLMAKNALKNLARIKSWSFTESNNFAKLIPETPGITLEQALKDEERIQQRLDIDDRAKALWEGAVEIEGTLNSLGIHAAGVIISDSALDERCPMMESDGQLLTQFENKFAEKIGLIKFDFLGLKTLTVIEKAVKFVREKYLPDFEIDNIELEDPVVYQNISTAHVTGVFQLESNGMRKLIADLKPTSFSDIVAVLALFRPGPLGSGMVEDFVLRKHGKNAVEYPLPELEPILADTYGVMVFQEQIQKIAAVLASYSLGEADLLRRAMGKKDKNEMEKQKARFTEGAEKNGHDTKISGEIFDLMAKFADYGFNKSHTAAYGWVTYQTAYLKTYYPTEFMTAIMSCDLDNTDKIVTYVRDCKRMNIVLLPPNVNHSYFEFSIPTEKTIQFGLGAIKGLGKGIIDCVVKEREANGSFKTVPEFIARVDARKVNKKVMESLIKSGAFDSIASNRNELLHNCDPWVRAISKEADRQDKVGAGIFGAFVTPSSVKAKKIPLPAVKNLSKASGKTSGKTVRKNALIFAPTSLVTETIPDETPVGNLLVGVQLKPSEPWSLIDQLENEFSALGFYMTGHPSDVMRQDIEELSQIPISDAPLNMDADSVPEYKRKSIKLAGIVTAVFEKKTKDNDLFCVLKIEDGTGEIEVAIFAKQYAALSEKFVGGDAVWVECKIRRGVEEGSVKASCQSIGKISDKRVELVKRIVLQARPEFLSREENLTHLRAVLTKNHGSTPVLIEIEMPAEKMRVRATLGSFSVKPTDAFIHQIEKTWPGQVKVHRSYRQLEIQS